MDVVINGNMSKHFHINNVLPNRATAVGLHWHVVVKCDEDSVLGLLH